MWKPPIMSRQKGQVGGAVLPLRHSSEAHSPHISCPHPLIATSLGEL